jgi:hypothetical protein
LISFDFYSHIYRFTNSFLPIEIEIDSQIHSLSVSLSVYVQHLRPYRYVGYCISTAANVISLQSSTSSVDSRTDIWDQASHQRSFGRHKHGQWAVDIFTAHQDQARG